MTDPMTTAGSMRRSPLPLVASIPPAPPSTPRLGLGLYSSPSPLSISSLSRDRRHICRDRSAASIPRGSPRCGEVAGGTAAGCAAICCCCPCGIVNLVLLTLVALPAGLCRKAIRRRRRKTMRRRSASAALIRRSGEEGATAMGMGEASSVAVRGGTAAAIAAAEVVPSEEMVKMEKEMWELFYDTGFWRSPSQREN